MSSSSAEWIAFHSALFVKVEGGSRETLKSYLLV